MRVKLERLAHTVGLAHRSEESKLGGGAFGGEEEDGWTPESILASLQAATEKRDDCLRQIDELREEEGRLWQSLPEWRTRLQAARQGWSDMWKVRASVMPICMLMHARGGWCVVCTFRVAVRRAISLTSLARWCGNHPGSLAVMTASAASICVRMLNVDAQTDVLCI